jgi:hypothetical protein
MQTTKSDKRGDERHTDLLIVIVVLATMLLVWAVAV